MRCLDSNQPIKRIQIRKVQNWILKYCNLSIMNTVGFHHIEQRFLTNTSFLLEEVMFWICSCNVSPEKQGVYYNPLVTNIMSSYLITFSHALWVRRRGEYFALSWDWWAPQRTCQAIPRKWWGIPWRTNSCNYQDYSLAPTLVITSWLVHN